MNTDITTMKTGTMRNASFDFWMIIAPLALACLIAVILKWNPGYTALAVAAALWGGSNTHAVMTYMKLGWNDEGRRKYYHFFTWVPLVLLGFFFFIWGVFGAAAMLSIYYYAQLFHYVRQSYGLSGIYRRTSLTQTPDWLHQIVTYFFPLFALLLIMDKGFFYFGALMYGFRVGDVGIAAFGFLTVCACVYWLFIQLSDLIKGRFSIRYFAFMVSHFIIFYIGLLYFDNKTQGYVCMAFWHSMQYILFIWNNFQRISEHKTGGEVAFFEFISRNIYLLTALSFLFGGVVIYALKLIIGGTALWAVPVLFVVLLMFNFNHYIIDAVIWRRPRSKAT